tara:strand:- start:452 stop:1399 length:948 start_codon:yes stop_codon:yes gene_type:complete
MKKNFKIILNAKNKKDYLVTVAIGRKCLGEWEKYAKPLWLKYCKKYSLGLIVITSDLIDKKDPFWKKATWQKMLIGTYLSKAGLKIKNICILDVDILINPNSPNIFKYHDEKKISLVSQVNNLPYDLNFIRKRVSFNRNKFYSKKYKLDSALFMSLKQIYKYHKLKPQKDYACSGVIVFNNNKFSRLMKSWFYKYKKDLNTLTGGGEEPIFNYEMFKTGKTKMLDYKFQALWLYEIANKFPFLYENKNQKNTITKKCVQASLEDNYFLHFAGKWEGNMWKIKNIISNESIKSNNSFLSYLKKKSYGKPIGRILPK